jgi:catechol 2,3-dioxygenase-like lactoylglutathione lyase family enzyme
VANRKLVVAVTVSVLALSSWCFGQERPKITSLSHLSVYTTDAPKTERFYVHDLGAHKGSDVQNSSGARFYFNPLQYVEVLPLPSGTPPKLRFDHAGLNTANAEGMRRYLAAHNVAVPSGVTRGSDGSQYFEVRDPEGNRIQFVQASAKPPVVPINPVSKHIIHVGFIVHDQALEDAFYIGVLGFRPYWHGGMSDQGSDWVSLQVPDGSDWIEYMLVKGPEKTGIPASMSQDSAGVLDHFSLGVQNMEKAVGLLYAGDRLTAKHSDPKIGRDGKWQFNMYDPDGIRAELMEFQPTLKPCCSPFLLPSPTR